MKLTAPPPNKQVRLEGVAHVLSTLFVYSLFVSESCRCAPDDAYLRRLNVSGPANAS